MGNILIIAGAAGAVVTLILIPICTAVLRKKGKRLTERIFRQYE